MVTLHPTLAAKITAAVLTRGIASDAVGRVISTKPFCNADYLFWRDQHIKATAELLALGIELPTYTYLGSME